MAQYLLDRLFERSTWLGIIGFATAAGANIEPEQASAIVTIGTTLASSIAIFTRK